jgi:hypothetical protein
MEEDRFCREDKSEMGKCRVTCVNPPQLATDAPNLNGASVFPVYGGLDAPHTV